MNIEQLTASLKKNEHLPSNNRFNFGKFRMVTFEDAVTNPEFSQWIRFMYTGSNRRTDAINRDLSNFERYLAKYATEEGFQEKATTAERLDFLFPAEEVKEDDGVFWFGKHKGCHLNDVDIEYLAWWADKLIKDHPPTHEWWKTPDGDRHLKLLTHAYERLSHE